MALSSWTDESALHPQDLYVCIFRFAEGIYSCPSWCCKGVALGVWCLLPLVLVPSVCWTPPVVPFVTIVFIIQLACMRIHTSKSEVIVLACKNMLFLGRLGATASRDRFPVFGGSSS